MSKQNFTELRRAAKAFYNMTIADTEVRISTSVLEKAVAIEEAGKRLEAILLKTKHPKKERHHD